MKPVKKTAARMKRRTENYMAMIVAVGKAGRTAVQGSYTAPGSENRHKTSAAGRRQKRSR